MMNVSVVYSFSKLETPEQFVLNISEACGPQLGPTDLY